MRKLVAKLDGEMVACSVLSIMFSFMVTVMLCALISSFSPLLANLFFAFCGPLIASLGCVLVVIHETKDNLGEYYKRSEVVKMLLLAVFWPVTGFFLFLNFVFYVLGPVKDFFNYLMGEENEDVQ